MTHFRPEFGILAHRNRDIGIPVTDLGYWDIAQKEVTATGGFKIGILGYGSFEIGILGYGSFEIGIFGILGPPLRHP